MPGCCSVLVDIDGDDPVPLRFYHVAGVTAGVRLPQLLPHASCPAPAVAGVLAELDASGKPVEASLVAYHYELGGDAERAIDATFWPPSERKVAARSTRLWRTSNGPTSFWPRSLRPRRRGASSAHA